MTAAMPLFGSERPAADLILGDCREVMASMPEASIDAIVCDPPYGLSFMGRGWDHSVPGPDFWGAALRVAKPGAHLVAFGGTRTWHRLVCAIEDAGWEVRDSLMWVYGTGFPKSLDVSKALDKAAGAEREVVAPDPQAARRNRGTPQFGGASMNEYDPGYDGPLGRMAITAPATDLAKRAAGWGTALKPAHEPIVLARKPLAGTVAANFAAHGTGGINVDGCRIGTGGGGTHCTNRDEAGRCRGHANAGRSTSGETFHGPNASTSAGRWPANVILDEEAARALDEQSGERKSGGNVATAKQGPAAGSYMGGGSGADPFAGYADTGGASRFFYCAKASRAERGEVNDWPTVKPLALMRWLCRLVTPAGGVVLDPFHGSGSTLLAARAEGFRSIGIDMDEHAREIALARLAR